MAVPAGPWVAHLRIVPVCVKLSVSEGRSKANDAY